MRVSRFKLDGNFAGKDGAKVEIVEVDPGQFEFRIRPKHSRDEVKADLADIVRHVLAGGRMQVDDTPVEPPSTPVKAAKKQEEVKTPNVDSAPVRHKKPRKKSPSEIAKGIVSEKPWYLQEEEDEKKGKK